MGVTRISVVVATYGDAIWAAIREKAVASARRAGAEEVIVEHYPLGTLASVRNAAGRRATGDWLCFLDADDELDVRYLEAMSYHIDHLGNEWPPPLLVPQVTYVHPGHETPPAIPNKGGWPTVNECVIGTLVHRTIFERAGGFREWPSLEDYDLWLTCHELGCFRLYAHGAVYRATVSAGRNLNQSCYWQIRERHRVYFDLVTAPFHARQAP